MYAVLKEMTTTPNRPVHARWFQGACLLYMLILSVCVISLSDYGMTWDEVFRFSGGDAKLAYYEGLSRGEAVNPPGDSYPGLFDLPVAWVHSRFPEWGTRSEIGHIYSLFFGAVGLLAAWRTSARLGGERAGFWALLLLATTPRYYGHMFFNPKDIPLAATYALGIWALVAAFKEMPQMKWRSVVWIGLSAGLAMSTRIAGFLILCYFGLFVLIYLMFRFICGIRRGDSGNVRQLFRAIGYWLARGGLAGALAFIVVFPFWPALHQNPFERAAATVGTVQSFDWSGKVLMDGYFWDAGNLPIYYIPYWLVRTLPEMILLLLAAGVILLLRMGMRGRRCEGLSAGGILSVGVLLFAFVFPLIYLMIIQPTLYDGMRHFLFVLPSLVIAAALSFEWLLRIVREANGAKLAVFLQVALVGAVMLVVIEMVRLHPYQYLYFNQASGGLPAAYTRDETDYWGLSHKEAGTWLNALAEDLDPQGERTFKVHQRYSRWMLKEALDPERFEMTPEREGADFFVSVTRFNLHVSYPEAELIHVVERRGVPLCFIFQLDQPSEQELPPMAGSVSTMLVKSGSSQ